MCSSLMNRLLLVVALTAVSWVPNLANARDDDSDKNPPGPLQIKLRDTCDPVSFNAAFGVGTCVGSFSTTLAQFFAELGQDQTVGAWRFHPLFARANKGTQLIVTNFGGELHTFTKVKEFGGGFVQPLNDASGNPIPAPECADVVNGQLVPKSPSATNLFVPAGQSVPGPVVKNGKTEKFMCCIHPWMRMTINPKGHAERALANP